MIVMPSPALVYLLFNKCGMTYVLVIFSGHDVLVNVFALGSRLGLAAGWTAQAVMTIEQYPTVIRLVAEFQIVFIWF